jgi:hypothetical protein
VRHSRHLAQNSPRFVPREHDGETFRAIGADNTFEPSRFFFQISFPALRSGRGVI